MLQSIRDNMQGTLAKIVIAIIIVPFALFGIESMFGGGGVVVVAEVNGAEITEQELQNEISRQQQRLLRQMGENVDPAMLEESRLRDPALQALVQRKLLLQSARDLGLHVGAANVDQIILGMEEFQENGEFSPELYQRVLRSQGLGPNQFKQLLREQLLISQLNAAISGSEFLTAEDMELAVGVLAQTRSFDYLVIDSEAMLDEVEVSEAAMREYYEAHQSEFMTPERVRLNYIELTEEQFFESIDEETLRTAYQSEIEAMDPVEERRASHILLEFGEQRTEEEALELARDLKRQLREGAEFAALAQEYSDDLGSADAGGDVGYTSGDTFPPAFEEALSALEQGAVSGPVVTDAGVHLIKLTDVAVSEVPSFAERRDLIERRLQRERAEVELVKVVEQLRDLSFNAADLQMPAEELGLEVQESGWVTKGTDSGLFDAAALKRAAFSEEVLVAGHNSEVVELAPDHFVVLRVAEHQQPTLQPFAAVAEQVETLLRRQRATELAQEQAQELIAAAEQSGELPAAEQGQWQSADTVNRAAPQVPPAIGDAAFQLPHPPAGEHLVDAVTLPDNRVVVLRLRAVEAGRVDDLQPAEQRALASQVLQSESRNLFNLFLNSAKRTAEIDYL